MKRARSKVSGKQDIPRQLLQKVKRLLQDFKPFLVNKAKYLVEYTGHRSAALGGALLSMLLAVWFLSLFAFLFAIVFAVLVSIGLFVALKLIIYKPRKSVTTIDGEQTVLSYVKDIDVMGGSEIVIHSQPRNSRTFVILDNNVSPPSIINCGNIADLQYKSYRNIDVRFFCPIEKEYKVGAFVKDQRVGVSILEKTPDNCKVCFEQMIYKPIRLVFKEG